MVFLVTTSILPAYQGGVNQPKTVDFLVPFESGMRNYLQGIASKSEWLRAFKYSAKAVLRVEVVSLQRHVNIDVPLSSYNPNGKQNKFCPPETLSRVLKANAELLLKPAGVNGQAGKADENQGELTIVMRFKGLLRPFAVVLR